MSIRKMRSRLGISQLELAKTAGVSRYRVYMHENGYIKLRPHEAKRIRAALVRRQKELGLGVQLSLGIGGGQCL